MEGIAVFLLIVLLILVVLAAIFLIYFFLMRNKTGVGLGGACTSTSNCASGLVCDTGVCRATHGGACSNTNQCSSGLVCDNGICMTSSGGTCLNGTQCATGLVCLNGVCTGPASVPTRPVPTPTPAPTNMPEVTLTPAIPAATYLASEARGTAVDVNGSPRYRLPETQVIDVIGDDREVIFLAGDHAFRASGANSEKITFNRRIERMVYFGPTVVGLSRGSLYIPEDTTSNSWIWREVSWSPKSLFYINGTYDRQSLWAQSWTEDRSEGRLYAYEGPDCALTPVQTQKLAAGEIRVYGENYNSYLEINQRTSTAKFYTGGHEVERINGIAHGIVVNAAEGDRVFAVRPSEQDVLFVRYINGEVHEIRPMWK